MSKKSQGTNLQSRPLVHAIVQNDAVKETVKQSADELLVVSAVLKQVVPNEKQSGDVAAAIKRNETIGNVISESADELAAVNDLLIEEIDERIGLERKLLASQAALARAQTAAKTPTTAR